MRIAPEVLNQWNRFQNEKIPGLMETFSINITELDRGLVKASMPVTATVNQPFGFLHGGASVALAETLASLGSWLMADPDTQQVRGLEINANHLNSVKNGHIHAEANLLHNGHLTHVWQITILDDNNRPVCVSRCTISVKEHK
ncbi:MAG: PaaI family thioesterase [Balneolales bacterium]